MIHWNSLAEFAAMGGHGPYVWGSFGVAALLLALEVALLGRRGRTQRARLARRHAADDRNRSQS